MSNTTRHHYARTITLTPNTTMKRILPLLAAFFLLFAAHPALAQNRWSMELNSGGAYATQDLGDADLGAGLGFELTVAYRFMPHLAAYGGWGWRHFAADQSFAGADMDFEETGYTFGLQFVHPTALSRLSYMVQAGGIYNHIEVENGDGDITGDSGHGLGWQAGAGLVYALTSRWSIVPSVRYRSLSRDIEIESVTTDVDLTYLSFGIGFTRTF